MHEDDTDVTIVIGIDGSLSSERAFAFALGTAQGTGGRVIAAYVAPLTSPAISIGMAIGAAIGFLPSVDDAAKPIADEIRSHVAAACAKDGIDAVFCSLFGDPSTALARLANRTNADLVIVGTSRPHTRWFSRSVGRSLMRNATWPVVVVP